MTSNSLVFLLAGCLSLFVITESIASDSTAENAGHEPSKRSASSSPYAKAHGHEHAKLCSREKCYEYCDDRENHSEGGLLRRLRRECRKDCMEGCEAPQAAK